ncbi:energy-coupling factor ABC transporter substrate-binding protein [Streptomyces sp. MA15]|uniref:energy-coupling factor ABC transporter substrate-binding protein n=1 Tax=Streptomyces sp. MA15 TaxID=3055061 RepID=UPI0025B16B8F|nr:energy-coupling factor ABC transporter substrate-binding protein [Streptomyces sp. MA15]MDN3267291.1 energy-coupling factor ABC transporter substrate-binding protein [Streptomyces sp. MA15]
MSRDAKTNSLLLPLVAALAVIPLVFGLGDHEEEPFAGADGEAETAVTEIDPDYEPWFSPLYEPPSGEIESALSALRAAIGAGVLAYRFGLRRGRRQGEGRAPALLGRNGSGSGSGKTTLMRLLGGGLRPESGELGLAGRAVRHDRKGLAALRTTVQLVVQDPDDQLFPASVGQDVSFGPPNPGLSDAEVRERVAEALDIAGPAGRPTHPLSYGQRERAAIAGAVAMRPRVLILDEPTAGLGPDGQERLLAALGRLRANGTTVVTATHEVDLALRRADDAAPLTPPGAHTGPVAKVLSRRDLLTAAGPRLPWGVAAGLFLRARGPGAAADVGPRTPEEPAAPAAPPECGDASRGQTAERKAGR